MEYLIGIIMLYRKNHHLS